LRLTSDNFDDIVSVTGSGVDFTLPLSPDGSQIAFTARLGGNWDVCVVNIDGSGLTRLTTNPARDGLPTWSPYGQAIAFVGERDDGKWIIVTTDTNGSIQQELFEMEGPPDGMVFFDQADSTG
jgi:Tol biopolymer transport system component